MSRGQEVDSRLSRAAAELAETRERFVLSMSALDHEITAKLDWRVLVRRKLPLAMAMAFGLGLFLGRRP